MTIFEGRDFMGALRRFLVAATALAVGWSLAFGPAPGSRKVGSSLHAPTSTREISVGVGAAARIFFEIRTGMATSLSRERWNIPQKYLVNVAVQNSGRSDGAIGPIAAGYWLKEPIALTTTVDW